MILYITSRRAAEFTKSSTSSSEEARRWMSSRSKGVMKALVEFGDDGVGGLVAFVLDGLHLADAHGNIARICQDAFVAVWRPQ